MYTHIIHAILQAFNIKNIQGSRRPDGRIESTIEYKTSFQTLEGEDGIFITKFGDFQPYYRGKPANKAPSLDLSKISSFSIMCQSFFGEQEGDFEVVIAAISAVTDAWIHEQVPIASLSAVMQEQT